MKVEAEDTRMRQDIVRGIYFYNNGYFTNGEIPVIKINVFSEHFIKKMSAIVRIQKCWRGYQERKHIKK